MKFTIYRIVSINPELTNCYIGKTSNLHVRIIQHKSDCSNINSHRHNLPIYKYIRENGGFDNFEFINLKDEWLDGAENASTYEQHFFELYGGFAQCLNINYPNRKVQVTSLLYYYEHQDHVKKYQAKYRTEHKEQSKKYQFIYRNRNKNK